MGRGRVRTGAAGPQICHFSALSRNLSSYTNMSLRALALIALIVRDVVARVGAPRRRRLSCEGRSLRPATEAECAPLSEEEILALHSCDHESLRVGDLCEGDGDDLRVP